MVKRAYADWNRYAEYKRPFHEHAIELIDVPQSRYSGKNSADIRMVVDAMDLAYSKQHVDTFALVSGDSDFSPLVSKLRENDRYVIGARCQVLVVRAPRRQLRRVHLLRGPHPRVEEDPALDRGLPEKKAEVFAQLIDVVQALQRENKDTLWGSMVKQTMQPQEPRLQRVLLRVLDLLEAPRGRAAQRPPDDEEGRQERRLRRLRVTPIRPRRNAGGRSGRESRPAAKS